MTSTLSASAPRAIERRANHKLAVLRHVDEVSGNVAASCRYYGVSRQAYYAWLKRYEDEGFDGLKDRSSAAALVSGAPLAVPVMCLAARVLFGERHGTRLGQRRHRRGRRRFRPTRVRSWLRRERRSRS